LLVSAIFASLTEYSIFFWIITIFVTLLIGIGKTGFGGGLVAIATPLMSLTISVAEAAALLLPMLIIADVFAVRHYHDKVDAKNIRILLPAAIIGIVIGAFFFNSFSDKDRILKFSIGVIAVAFVIFQFGKAAIFNNLSNTKPSWTLGSIIGCFAGFTSTLAHVGGPPISIYLLPQGMHRTIYVGTSAIFFFVVNLLKLVAYFILGIITTGNLTIVLLLLPILYLGTLAGVWMLKRFNQVWFNRIIYILLFLTGIQLILGRSLISFIA